MKSKELAGGIIPSAWFELVNKPAQWQINLVNGFAKIVPGLTFSNRLDEEDISSVPSEVHRYKEDPLIHDRISMSLFKSLNENGQRVIAEKKKVKVPVLICHGDADKITSIEASKKYAEIQEDLAVFRCWSGSFHEPHHDIYKEEVIQFYAMWLLEKSGN